MEGFKLEEHIVTHAPPTVYYVPNFISSAEEALLWRSVYAAPKPKWKVLSNRRLQNWGGLPHERGMVAEPLPQWLSSLTQRLADLRVFGDNAPNHVLVNEYTPGQGIMAHEDGPLFQPTVATVTTGCHTLLNLFTNTHPHEPLVSRFIGSLLLEPRSLLVLREEAYTSRLHDIADTTHDLVNEARVLNWSLTALGINSTRVTKSLCALQQQCSHRASLDTGTVNNEEVLRRNEDANIDSTSGDIVVNCSEKTETMKKENSARHETELFSNGSRIKDISGDDTASSFSPGNANYELELKLLTSTTKNDDRHSSNGTQDSMSNKGAEMWPNPAEDGVLGEQENSLPLARVLELAGLTGSGSCAVSANTPAPLTVSASTPLHFQICRGTRVSLTIRRVPKVIKSKIFLTSKR